MREINEAKLIGELEFFKSLKKQIENLLKEESDVFGDFRFNQIAGELIKKFNQATLLFNSLMGLDEFEGVKYVSLSENESDTNKYRAKLHTLIPECDKAIGILNSQLTALSGTQAMELRKLREDLKETLSKLPDIYEKNMEEAIKACEKGYFLSSALISSRIITFVLDQIPGKEIKDKIKNLKNKGLVTEKGEMTTETIMKADKKARNYFSHDLKAFPDSSEALELLGSCGRLLKLLEKYEEKC